MDPLDHSSARDEIGPDSGAHAHTVDAVTAHAGDKGVGAAAEIDDLDAMRKSVEDAAAVSTGLWISYLFMLFYIAIAAGAVTHLDLLLENSVKLPFLGIELPLLAFFFVAPLLFLIVHAYTLVHFVMLGKKSVQFHDSLYAHFPSAQTAAITAAEDERNRQIRTGIRRQLPSNIFVQFLAGPRDVRDTGFGQLLRFIAWITLIFAPVALLLELQVQFLPYHNLRLTWEHRLALLFDIILIWWLWKKILGDGVSLRGWQGWQARSKTVVGAIFSVGVVWISCSLAIIPGEWQEFTAWEPLYQHLFHGAPDPNSHRPASLFSNILVLPHLNVYDILKVDDPQKVAWRPFLLSLRGRDLRGAIFNEAVLERTDARSTQLQGASFGFASLQGSELDDADLQGAYFLNAQLQGASLLDAHLEGAELSGAGLQGAKLEKALLMGADMVGAQLQGANLRGADLRGADLEQASLRGTSFADVNKDATQLQGANFDQATFDVVSLDRALLWRALFSVKSVTSIFGTPVWDPQAQWGPDLYKQLQATLDTVPELNEMSQQSRVAALMRIASLDCATKDPAIATCVVPSPPPPNVSQWQNKVKSATLVRASYDKTLAAVYVDIICSGDGNSLAILRSLANMAMPQAAGGTPKQMGLLESGGEAKGLIETIMSNKCHVSAQLTDSDRATLFAIERFSEQLAGTTTSPQSSTPQK